MYQIVVLDAIGGMSAVLQSTLTARFRDLSIDLSEVEFLDGSNLSLLQKDSRKVAGLFSGGSAGLAFDPQVRTLLAIPVVVIPAVTSRDNIELKIPDPLLAINALELDPRDPELEELAGLILELLGLLRKRRRLFISYKRSESSAVAQQLYHALDERTFDVFLDTMSLRPAAEFQEMLWHRMTDSDVVVLLYTASTHSSGWVEKEIQRALGMKITVLQLIWPFVPRDPSTRFFEPMYLDHADFDPAYPDRLLASKATAIGTLVESLRASSLARREAELVTTLQIRAAIHSRTTFVRPARYVDVHCDPQTFTRVIPVVGVPDSESFQAGVLAPVEGVSPQQIVLLYDSLNVTTIWNAHLGWLRDHLPVKAIKAFEIDNWLSNLCK
jgi:hypothetical protein